MRCVESGVQSGLYLAPMSTAFSLKSPLMGFWKPLRTNTTPSRMRFKGTCCALVFGCLGLGSGLEWLSRFFSADFCAGDAGEKNCRSQRSFPGEEIIYIQDSDAVRVTFRGAGAGRAGGARLGFGGRSFPLR